MNKQYTKWITEYIAKPIIATILLGAVFFLVLFMVFYFMYLNGYGYYPSTPRAVCEIKSGDFYTEVTIKNITEEVPLNKTYYQILSTRGLVEIGPDGKRLDGDLSDVCNLNISANDTYIAFNDSDGNGKLSAGDIIFVKNVMLKNGDVLRVGYTKSSGEIFMTPPLKNTD